MSIYERLFEEFVTESGNFASEGYIFASKDKLDDILENMIGIRNSKLVQNGEASLNLSSIDRSSIVDAVKQHQENVRRSYKEAFESLQFSREGSEITIIQGCEMSPEDLRNM